MKLILQDLGVNHEPTGSERLVVTFKKWVVVNQVTTNMGCKTTRLKSVDLVGVL